MCARSDLEGVTLYHLHTSGPYPFVAPEHRERFYSVSLFVGPALRQPVAEGHADFMPIFLSEIPELFRSGEVPLDVAVVQVSPPDAHGLCTLGTSVDAAQAAVHSARIILAEINERMPRTHGHTVLPLSRIHAFTHTDRALVEHPASTIGEVEGRIGELVADLVEDGATLQLG
ncbi:MAG: 4-hydroxybutyrate CoA-transferase, partial [Myxococcales bacterium]|nr:4-hydroxybutyrate CoA-transferase [Myxococcales bacterium]